MTNADREKLKEEMYKPAITMKESRKLCNTVEVTSPLTGVP